MEFSVKNNVSADAKVALTTLLSLNPTDNVAILPQRDLRFGPIDVANSHGKIVRHSGTSGAFDMINTGSGNTNFYNGGTTLKMKLKGGSDGHIALYGGSETIGANIEIYGARSDTHANKIYYDATVHTFRLQNATNIGVTIDSTGLKSTIAPTNDDNVITKKYLIDNTSNTLIFFDAATDIDDGWYTIAYSYSRATAKFGIADRRSSYHQSVIFTASSTYGTDDSHNIFVQENSFYANNGVIEKIRIREGATHSGSLLQVYVGVKTPSADGRANDLTVYLLGDNFQNTSSGYPGWVLTPWVADGTKPAGFTDSDSRKFVAITNTAASVDINAKNGGLFMTDEIYAGGSTEQYRVLHEGAGGTLAGDGLTITGHSSPDLSLADSGRTVPRSAYADDATNLWLKGNSAGVSGIFFESSKDGTRVNSNSDGAFIQYRAYGIDNTSGEQSDLVIGITNDATAENGDKIVFNTPGKDQLVITYDAGATEHKIWHAGNDGTSSGLDADKLDGYHASSFALKSSLSDYSLTSHSHVIGDITNLPNFLRADADDSFSGNLVSTGRNKSICGNYDNTKIDQIWTIGTSFKIDSDGGAFGNLYGLAYKPAGSSYTHSTGGAMGGKHQMVWCHNGDPKGAIGHDRVWHAAEVKAPTGQFEVVNTNSICGNDNNNALVLRADPKNITLADTASIYLASKYDPGELTGTFDFPQIFYKADYHTFSASTARADNPDDEPVAVIPPTVHPFADNHLVRKDYVDNMIQDHVPAHWLIYYDAEGVRIGNPSGHEYIDFSGYGNFNNATSFTLTAGWNLSIDVYVPVKTERWVRTYVDDFISFWNEPSVYKSGYFPDPIYTVQPFARLDLQLEAGPKKVIFPAGNYTLTIRLDNTGGPATGNMAWDHGGLIDYQTIFPRRIVPGSPLWTTQWNDTKSVLSTYAASYFPAGAVISGNSSGTWTGTGVTGNETLKLHLRRVDTNTTTVSNIVNMSLASAESGREFSVNQTITLRTTNSRYTIPAAGYYQLVNTAGDSGDFATSYGFRSN